MFIVGIIVICIIGTLLHFTYEWSHHKKIVALFSAVNESTWEHIKIAMTPTILWSIFYGYINDVSGNYIVALSLSLLVIIILIPILFYSYTAITKKAILSIDVICFIITIICSQFVFKYFINLSDLSDLYVFIGIILFTVEIIMYLVLTFNPLNNYLFKDPITNKFGLEGHPCHHHEH